MPEKSRSAGTGILSDVPRGAHLCPFYETPEDLVGLPISHIRVGLGDRDRQNGAAGKKGTSNVIGSYQMPAIHSYGLRKCGVSEVPNFRRRILHVGMRSGRRT